MTKTRALQVRLSIAEHEQLKHLAERKGFASLAAYLRHMGLDQDFLTHDRIAELHRRLVGDTDSKARDRRRRPAPASAAVEAPGP